MRVALFVWIALKMANMLGIKFFTKKHMEVVVIAVIPKLGSLKVFVSYTLAKYKTFLSRRKKSRNS